MRVRNLHTKEVSVTRGRQSKLEASAFSPRSAYFDAVMLLRDTLNFLKANRAPHLPPISHDLIVKNYSTSSSTGATNDVQVALGFKDITVLSEAFKLRLNRKEFEELRAAVLELLPYRHLPTVTELISQYYVQGALSKLDNLKCQVTKIDRNQNVLKETNDIKDDNTGHNDKVTATDTATATANSKKIDGTVDASDASDNDQITRNEIAKKSNFSFEKELKLTTIPSVWLKRDELGQYYKSYGSRKSAYVRAYVFFDGTGQLLIDGKPHHQYFRDTLYSLEAIKPLIVTGLLGKVDVAVQTAVHQGGVSSIARSIRLAIARVIAATREETYPLLDALGYLIRDPRKKERKKPGQPGARKQYRWRIR